MNNPYILLIVGGLAAFLGAAYGIHLVVGAPEYLAGLNCLATAPQMVEDCNHLAELCTPLLEGGLERQSGDAWL